MVTFKFKRFNELELMELYGILALRNAVFIVEQNCPYQDIDGKDEGALHMFFEDGDEVIACLRIILNEIPAIGRVVVHEKFRKKGVARELMQRAVGYLIDERKSTSIKLQAQVYLENFYKSLGFERISQEYLEDNIPHVDMLMDLKKSNN